jgi:hypothetical protein
LLTNTGNNTAQNVIMYFRYSTAQGDTVLTFASSPVRPQAMAAIDVPPQITRGELRFPYLERISFSGQQQFPPTGESPPRLGYPSNVCLLSQDSARVYIRDVDPSTSPGEGGGLAYHVVMNVETTTGVAQIPLQQNPIGRLWITGICGNPAEGCDGWGTFHVPVRDSTGIKLAPKFTSVRWENYAGVADSVVLHLEAFAVSFSCTP